MDVRDYQRQAAQTDQTPGRDERGLVVPLLGLAGEVGSLLAEHKKHLRDGPAHRLFREQVAEDLGDLLWYVANVATKFDLDLGEVAVANLAKTRDRWPPDRPAGPRLFDADLPPAEQLPRRFEVELREVVVAGRPQVQCWWEGREVGDPLTDNAPADDGYRFHDVFHFGFAALLGWSPITRRNLGRKRRSRPAADEVEDGGRAKVIEECVSALAYDYARQHAYLEDVPGVGYPLLKAIRGLVADREVRACSLHEWERAILGSYAVWRRVWANRGGVVVGDLLARTYEYRPTEQPAHRARPE